MKKYLDRDNMMYQENVNYEKWQKMDLWELWQGIFLLLDKEPQQSGYRKLNEGYSQFGVKFEEIAEMAEASFLRGALKFHTSWPTNILLRKLAPSVFLNWAQKKGFELHESFIDLFSEESQKSGEEMETKNTTQEIESIPMNTLRPSQVTKLICQGIARTLWDIYPKMTIEDMKKHHAIVEYGGGKYYTGKNTLRDWLSEVDPRDPKIKTGRPSGS